MRETIIKIWNHDITTFTAINFFIGMFACIVTIIWVDVLGLSAWSSQVWIVPTLFAARYVLEKSYWVKKVTKKKWKEDTSDWVC